MRDQGSIRQADSLWETSCLQRIVNAYVAEPKRARHFSTHEHEMLESIMAVTSAILRSAVDGRSLEVSVRSDFEYALYLATADVPGPYDFRRPHHFHVLLLRLDLELLGRTRRAPDKTMFAGLSSRRVAVVDAVNARCGHLVAGAIGQCKRLFGLAGRGARPALRAGLFPLGATPAFFPMGAASLD